MTEEDAAKPRLQDQPAMNLDSEEITDEELEKTISSAFSQEKWSAKSLDMDTSKHIENLQEWRQLAVKESLWVNRIEFVQAPKPLPTKPSKEAIELYARMLATEAMDRKKLKDESALAIAAKKNTK